MWFVGVHRVWLRENCESCFYGRSTEEYRVFGFAVKTSVLDPGTGNVVYKITRDLGIACRHPELHTFVEYRWCGLLFCCEDRHALWVTGGQSPWYDARGMETLKRMVERDPHLPETFRKRVIQDKDSDYLCSFLSEFKREMAALDCSDQGDTDTNSAPHTSP
jgi:hypothetical protein